MAHAHTAEYNKTLRELNRKHAQEAEAFRVANAALSDEEFDAAWEPISRAQYAAVAAATAEHNRIDRELRAAGAIR